MGLGIVMPVQALHAYLRCASDRIQSRLHTMMRRKSHARPVICSAKQADPAYTSTRSCHTHQCR